MNFYFLFYQMTGTAERLEGEVKSLASNALRTSPRDGQANRALLERCGDMLQGVKELLNSNSHISKVQLRRTAIIFQALEIAHRRVHCLAEAATAEDQGSVKALWWLLCMAQRDYRTLRRALGQRIGAPANLDLPEEEEDLGFTQVLRKDSAFQEEVLKLVEKGLEVFGEERELVDQLELVRKGLLEERKYIKRSLHGNDPERERALSVGQGEGVAQA